MMLSQKIAAAAEALGAGAPASSTIAVEDGSLQLLIDLSQAGPVGMAVREIQLHNAGSHWSIADLSARSERIAAKVTYLMEPLRLVETDSEALEVELRSVCPTKRMDRSSFYQARLKGDGRFSLKRVSFNEGDRQRVPVDMQLTSETLERLADDLADSLR